MTRHVCFFPQYSFQLILHHWKCCRMFFLFEISAQMKYMAACFLFYRIFFSISVLFVYALLILIWQLKPAGSWKLADSDWVCLMGVKAQIKKAECVFNDMKCEIRRLQSIRTDSSWLNHALYLSHYILSVCQR